MSPPTEKGSRELQSLRADWIAKVVRDPAKPAGATTLVGYVGDSHKEGHIRLYADSELTSYVDIPTGDVLYGQRLPEAQSPLGEAVLWVKRDAALVQGAEAAQGAGSWFEGPIVTDQYTTAAAAYGGAGYPGGFPGAPATFQCGPLLTIPPQCPLPTAPTTCCPITVPWRCPPTVPWQGCPPTVPWQGCPPTVPWQGCPPLTPLCPRTPVRPCITQLTICRTPLCPVKTALVACVRTPVLPCLTQNIICNTGLCPRTPVCPVNTAFCPNSGFICTGVCPSAVDACPSAPGGCDPWTIVINPGETVVNPGAGTINPYGTVINPGGWTGGMYG